MTSKEMPIEKVRKMLQLDWEAMKKLGHSEDDLDMLESEITDAIAGHLCPGDFLPGERHEDGDCPNDCSACWGGYVELVKDASKMTKQDIEAAVAEAEDCETFTIMNKRGEPGTIDECGYFVDYSDGWRVVPTCYRLLCWSPKYNAFIYEPEKALQNREYCEACRFENKEAALETARQLLKSPSGKYRYMQWSSLIGEPYDTK